MTNAVKFTRKGRIVVSGQIRIKAGTFGELLLEVCVTDTGIGMAAEQVSKVFVTPHHERSPESRKLNPYGNGLGLPFCK